MRFQKIGLAIGVILILASTAWIPAAHGTGPYLVYSLLALMAFGLELAGGSTMGFFFVILAVPHLEWWAALPMAGSAMFIHATLHRERIAPKLLLRSVGATFLAILATQAIFHAPNFARFPAPVRLMLAACVCFVVLRTLERRVVDLWTFPYYPVAAAIAALFPASLLLPPLAYLTFWSYRLYERRIHAQRNQWHQAASLQLRTLETLALAIEAKDQPMVRRSARVQVYAVEIAKELELAPLEIEALRAASLLYDIGELAVPEHIMLKPGPLTAEEFEKVKIHPLVGAEIVEHVNFPYAVAPIVRAHHERWDGTGYPKGLKGEEIPIGARILAAVDALDALASPRRHRPALPIEQALRAVADGSGGAYEPRIIALICKRYRQWERLQSRKPDCGIPDSILSAQREASVLLDLNRALSGSLDLKDSFGALKSALHNLVPCDTFVVWVRREERLVAEYVSGAHMALFSSLKIPRGGGVSGWVAAHETQAVNGDASLEMAHLGPAAQDSPLRLALSVPLAEAGLRGALTLYRAGEPVFTAEDARLLSTVAPKLAVAVANGLKFRRAADEALTDPLTGLPNADALFSRLGDCPPAAVVVCDLDGFKRVNDRFGHLVGNRLLVELAAAFRKSCREGDFIARLGGDEFVLLFDRIDPSGVGTRMAQFRETVRTTGRQVCGEDCLDASFGAAFHPADGTTPDELLALADRRMYQCKVEDRAGVLRMERKKEA